LYLSDIEQEIKRVREKILKEGEGGRGGRGRRGRRENERGTGGKRFLISLIGVKLHPKAENLAKSRALGGS
jgi:hypothetical protein